jgi:hypothetical protein
MIDMLECTLWQRQLGSLPEETVGALVAQVGKFLRRCMPRCISPASPATCSIAP